MVGVVTVALLRIAGMVLLVVGRVVLFVRIVFVLKVRLRQ